VAAQEKTNLTISTPLGKDVFILDRLNGTEQISSPFCFSLEMHSASPALDLSALVGKEVQITYYYGSSKRYFCGIVGTAEQGRTVAEGKKKYTFYLAKVYPKFWLLKFTQDYRIFQNKSALDIIKAVLSENGVIEIQDKTSSCGKRVRKYCVQYGESCFNFVSRLMEEEGIFYFFKHSSSNHTMVLADDSSSAQDISPASIKLMKSQTDVPFFNFVYALRLQEQVVAKNFAAADFNFKTPATPLYNKVSGEGSGGEVYHYPGLFMKSNEADLITNHRIQSLEWEKITLMGMSTTPTFCPMYSFTMEDHPRVDMNKKYVLYRVHHLISQVSQNAALEGEKQLYQSEFLAFPSTVPFRPPLITPKTLIHSTQTAIVTTKSGEEIWTDEFGRVKVKFHWDQRGSNDDKSSCWIRVAQLWAGNNWGGVFTPRVGMEVVVTFLDGDPDRPLITGCVYNGQNSNPYTQSEPTKSTIKSNTTKGGGGFNEFCFEDKKDSEQIYLHAQKDWDSVVEHSRTLEIKTGDDTTTITKGKRTVTLTGQNGDGNDTLVLSNGDQTISITGNRSATISKNDALTLSGDQTISITGNRSATISKNDTLNITGNLEITVTGNITLNATGNMTLSATGSMTVNATGGMNLQSPAAINMSATGPISIKSGAGVLINGGPTVAITGEAVAIA